MPLADSLMQRRRIGWLLFGVTAVLAVATIAGLIGAQYYTASLPAGEAQKAWKLLGVPAIALGGFLLTALAMCGSYYTMPMPTVRLKPVRINSTHIWLAGAAPEYLAQLPERGEP